MKSILNPNDDRILEWLMLIPGLYYHGERLAEQFPYSKRVNMNLRQMCDLLGIRE